MSHPTRTTAIPSLAALFLLSACGGADAPGGSAGGPDNPVERAAGAVADMVPGGYAQKLRVPSPLPDDPAAQLMAMAVQTADVPQESQVGIPAYPGARLLSTMGSMEMTVNDEEETMLPSLALLSEDEIEAVVAFYTENLAGWEHEEFFGSHMFWSGPEGSNPLDITGNFPVIGIVSLDADDVETKMWPGVKTRVDLRFVPGG